jgi:hypothetical protein
MIFIEFGWNRPRISYSFHLGGGGGLRRRTHCSVRKPSNDTIGNDTQIRTAKLLIPNLLYQQCMNTMHTLQQCTNHRAQFQQGRRHQTVCSDGNVGLEFTPLRDNAPLVFKINYSIFIIYLLQDMSHVPSFSMLLEWKRLKRRSWETCK